MRLSTRGERQRWVVYCDPLTVESLKKLSITSQQSIGYTLDQAVEYFCRKIQLVDHKPFAWTLPEDF